MRTKPITLFFSVLFFVLAFSSCSNGTTTNGSKDTSSVVPVTSNDSPAMQTDTSKWDSASTRPVKGPN